MAKEEIEFVDGLIVKAPHERAPDYVKATISIKVEDLGMWLRKKHAAGEQWVNIDVKEAMSGKWYAAVSTFKPKEATASKPAATNKPRQLAEDDKPF